jgi:uncharacterized protein YndB with AHSA1/START domain
MKPSDTFKSEPSGEREIIMTREFEAPRELVFEALTKPEFVQQWLLGPPGWTMPVCEIDLRVGGAYRYVWRNEDGREMGMGGNYTEVVPNERFVHTERFDEAWYAGESLNTWALIERNGRTLLTVTMRYETKATRDEVLDSGMESGVAVSYDRLDNILADMASHAAK